MNLEAVSKGILRGGVELSLKAVYQIELANLTFTKSVFNELNSNNQISNQKMNRNKKNADDISEIGIRGTVKAQFLNFMYNTAKTLINKKEELDFVAKILQVDDWKILNILYHNLVYYSLVQCFKS